jgi:hypothetical protein
LDEPNKDELFSCNVGNWFKAEILDVAEKLEKRADLMITEWVLERLFAEKMNLEKPQAAPPLESEPEPVTPLVGTPKKKHGGYRPGAFGRKPDQPVKRKPGGQPGPRKKRKATRKASDGKPQGPPPQLPIAKRC